MPRVIFLTLLFGASAFFFYIKANPNFSQTLIYWWQDATEVSAHHNILIGSSSIVRYPREQIDACGFWHKRGFNNGRLKDVMFYLNVIGFQAPKNVLIYIGENDLAQRNESVLQIVEEFEELLAKIEHVFSPSNIMILTIKQSPGRVYAQHRIKEFNRSIVKQIKSKPNISLVNFNNAIEWQSFSTDGVHLPASGYKTLSSVIVSLCQ